MEDPETPVAAAEATGEYTAGNESQGIEGGRVCERPSFRAGFSGEYSCSANSERCGFVVMLDFKKVFCVKT